MDTKSQLRDSNNLLEQLTNEFGEGWEVALNIDNGYWDQRKYRLTRDEEPSWTIIKDWHGWEIYFEWGSYLQKGDAQCPVSVLHMMRAMVAAEKALSETLP